jgi:hypothetical protein
MKSKQVSWAAHQSRSAGYYQTIFNNQELNAKAARANICDDCDFATVSKIFWEFSRSRGAVDKLTGDLKKEVSREIGGCLVIKSPPPWPDIELWQTCRLLGAGAGAGRTRVEDNKCGNDKKLVLSSHKPTHQESITGWRLS